MKPRLRYTHIFTLIVAGVINALSYTSDVFGVTLQAPIQLLTLSVLAHYIYRSRTPFQAFHMGMLYGIPSFAIGLSWLFNSIYIYGHLPAWIGVVAVILVAIFLSLYYALACWLTKRLNTSSKVLFALTFASAWTLSEWIRGCLFTGFPWNNVAYAHLDGILRAWVPILGSYGLTFMTALFAMTLTLLLHALYHHRQVLILANLVLSIIIVSLLLGLIQWGSPTGHRPIPIRLIQTNSSVADKFTPSRQAQDMEKILELITYDNINGFIPELIILPETTFARTQSNLPTDYLKELQNILQITHSTVFIGLPLYDKGELYNGIIQIGPHTSLQDIHTLTTPFYTKQHLVPFGEYVPSGFKWFTEMMQIPLGNFSTSPNAYQNFELGSIKFTPTVCYENLFGNELLPAIQDGGNILINVSNLIWFGNGNILEQYLNISRMRSIELARPMLLAANTGITGHIDAKGEVMSVLTPYTTASLDIWVQAYTGMTPFAYWGNYPIIITCILILIITCMIRTLTRLKFSHHTTPINKT